MWVIRCCLVLVLTLALGFTSSAQGQLFRDVTAEVGLDNYKAFPRDSHGPGGVFADLNNDGYPDLYLIDKGPAEGTGAIKNSLFVNIDNGDGTRIFQRLPRGPSSGGIHAESNGAIAGDYDNDGDLDLYVITFQDNVLLKNELMETGTLQFADVTDSTDPTPGNPPGDDQFGVAYANDFLCDNPERLRKSLTAAWADVDRDGDLDLFVGNHDNWWDPITGEPHRQTPVGMRDILYLNNGDGTFTDVTRRYGATGFETETGEFETSHQCFSSTQAAIFADFNNDLWPDLLVTNKTNSPADRDLLYINQGRDQSGDWQGFRPVTYTMPTPFGHQTPAAMGVDVGDFDHDGDLDIYLTDVDADVRWPPPFDQAYGNDLWVNQYADTGTLDFIHRNMPPESWSWGVQWVDVDNDGSQDVHVTTRVPRPDILHHNLPEGFFDVAEMAEVDQTGNSRGSMAADFNRDGWVDLFVVNIGTPHRNITEPSRLFQNETSQSAPHHYLTLKLQGDPSAGTEFRSSRDAIGARVYVRADVDGSGNQLTQMREVVSGSSCAASTSSLELEFGLGLAMTAVVEILWPSGRQDSLELDTDQILLLQEAPPQEKLLVQSVRSSSLGETSLHTPPDRVMNMP